MNLNGHIEDGAPALLTQALLQSAQKTERRKKNPALVVPSVSRLFLKWFTWYSRRYICRHFHAVRVSRSGLPPASNLPLVIYTNHASWWDPLVGLVLKSEFFADRTLFAPIDAAMLKRYKMLGKLGFFGVEQHSRRGAAQFLRMSELVLQSAGSLLAVTPQGRFADPRERPLRFEAGLGHLAARTGPALFVPVAMEYVFWEERLPEILVRFGPPVEAGCEQNAKLAPDQWTAVLQQKLERAQDMLSAESQRRDLAAFQDVLRGEAGQGGIYDWWRAAKARLRGEQFNREHGGK